MNSYYIKIKDNCISGILFLLPVLILLILIQKVFGYFSRFGSGIAKVIGLDVLMGKHAANFVGAIILFAFVYLCGYLVRLAFFKKMSDAIDSKLKDVIPGYEKHKELTTKQLVNKSKIETDLPVLIQFGDYWQPGFLIEQDELGNAVVVVPNSVSSQIYIVPMQKIKLLKETSLIALKTVVNSSGKGLLVCK
jgi:uncharacterized membrane protein